MGQEDGAAEVMAGVRPFAASYTEPHELGDVEAGAKDPGHLLPPPPYS